MHPEIQYSPRERFGLWCLAVVGFVALNGVFVYGLVGERDALRAALTNPIAVAFMAEALLLAAVLAYLLRRWGVSRVPWGWFVLLSLLGGIAFALPVALLWRRRGPA